MALTNGELIKVLQSYPEELPVRILDDWGSGFNLRPISNVLDSTEFGDSGEEAPDVILCYDLEGSEMEFFPADPAPRSLGQIDQFMRSLTPDQLIAFLLDGAREKWRR